MAPTGLLESFLGAIQASLSVLLVIAYGGIAAKLKLLTTDSTKAISKVCVRMFLPALLLTQIGSELHQGSARRYGLVLLWAVVTHLVSFLLGIFAHLALGMPEWTAVAVMFNNTTSYPLLLIQALKETGILQSLVPADEALGHAIERAKSYFLVYATVSSCLTFAVGPRLIDSEHAPEPDSDDDDDDVKDQDDDDETPPPQTDGAAAANTDEEAGATEHTGLLGAARNSVQFHDPFGMTSFFPSAATAKKAVAASPTPLPDRRASLIPRSRWRRLGPRVRWWLLFLSDFFNAPLVGALAGAVIGLVPALHRAFFADSRDGGVFTAWLTSSLRSVGGLFVPLPVVVAGVALFESLRRERVSRATVRALPWGTWAYILGVRFVLWPAASVGIIYALAARTSWLGEDPMLWFALMMMPTGPPAMKLVTLVQVSGGSEEEEANISRLLTISYLISPILSLTVVGSLRASQAAL